MQGKRSKWKLKKNSKWEKFNKFSNEELAENMQNVKQFGTVDIFLMKIPTSKPTYCLTSFYVRTMLSAHELLKPFYLYLLQNVQLATS